MTSAAAIDLPQKPEIDQWNDINDLPIFGTANRSVPVISLIEQIDQDDYSNMPFSTISVPAARVLSTITQIEQVTKTIETHIAHIYTQRSKTQNLADELKANNINEAKITPAAQKMYDEIINTFTSLKRDVDSAIQNISAVLAGNMFENGIYSNELIDKLCLLIMRLETLGHLCPTRSALTDDVSNLTRLLNNKTDPAAFQNFQMLRMWLSTPQSIHRDLLSKVSDCLNIQFDVVSKIFNIFWNRINNSISEKRYILADMETAYIISLMFMIDLYRDRQAAEAKESKKKKQTLKDLSKEVLNFLAFTRAKNPFLILYFEFAVDFDSFVVSERLDQKYGNKARMTFSLASINTQLRDDLNKFAQELTNYLGQDVPSDSMTAKMIVTVPEILRKVNSSIHLLRAFVIDVHNHANTTPEPEETQTAPKSKYEIAMTKTITDTDREEIMQILAICRSFRELIYEQLPSLSPTFSKYVQDRLQDFLKAPLDHALEKTKSMKNSIDSEIKTIRNISKSDKVLTSSPHISLLLLVRAQIQIFINPESPSMEGGLMKKGLGGTDVNAFNSFIKTSDYFIDMLKLEDTLSRACDQSSLYYKEYFLNIHRSNVKKSVYFPVTSSLPYTLIDYATKSSDKQDIVGALFYPLSIYDDAASTALKVLNCKFLYDEILAESEICVSAVVNTITGSSYQKVVKFFVDRFAAQYNPNALSTADLNQMAGNPLKITTFLQQNNFFLLGRHFNIKKEISDILTNKFSEDLNKLFDLITKFGLTCIHIFSKTSDILRETHKAFVEAGHILDNFDMIRDKVMMTHTSNSFLSEFLSAIINHTCSILIPSYFMHSNPYRLVPQTGEEGLSKALHGIRHIYPPSLRQTTAFVTVDHIREFLRIADDGAIYVFMDSVKSYVSDIFQEFCDIYQNVCIGIRRIPDVPIGSGCHKAYDRFEGAYRSFQHDDSINNLFDHMKYIGNLISFCFMLDIAYSVKRSSRQQVMTYLMENSNNSNVFSFFDERFRELSKYFSAQCQNFTPKASEINPPFLHIVVSEIANCIRNNWAVFQETTANILDFPTMTGFAAVWSVLEYVFCLKEVHRKDAAITGAELKQSTGSFAVYGEGVLVAAAGILCVTNQTSLSRAVSIGNRIIQQKQTDLAALDEEVLSKFFGVYKLVQASIESSIATLNPVVSSL
ncbi:hypothetical protein TRFO_03390 [Tritrichomonas foetus]|uniref:CYRIA/CYRIB Rac1 binding domain-containing protein n=1 Tax=Tritrichomonas foetus TaxID=1144522 RepID=A0A1J4KV90_9EUKA|nr:hypothetical protein TRFO_03390 [Tritrichomonas foetus]|eukprot:OHT13614.1 hypothetical protein TRFO_03390 [Tritrichomonas foetus]